MLHRTQKEKRTVSYSVRIILTVLLSLSLMLCASCNGQSSDTSNITTQGKDTGTTITDTHSSSTDTEPPSTDTEPPATETEPPATETEPPTTDTEPPTTDTEPPTTETEPPTTETEPPATETEPPATETEPPTTETEPPTTETEPPTTETEPPTVEHTANKLGQKEEVIDFTRFPSSSEHLWLSYKTALSDKLIIKHMIGSGGRLVPEYKNPLVLSNDDGYVFIDVSSGRPIKLETLTVSNTVSFGEGSYKVNFAYCILDGEVTLVNILDNDILLTDDDIIMPPDTDTPSTEPDINAFAKKIRSRDDAVLLYLSKNNHEYPVLYSLETGEITDILRECDLGLLSSISSIKINDSLTYALVRDDLDEKNYIYSISGGYFIPLAEDSFMFSFIDDTHLFYAVIEGDEIVGYSLDASTEEIKTLFRQSAEHNLMLLSDIGYVVIISPDGEKKATLLNLRDGGITVLLGFDFSSDTLVCSSGDSAEIAFINQSITEDGSFISTQIAMFDTKSGNFVTFEREGGCARDEYDFYIAADGRLVIVSYAANDQEHFFISLYTFTDLTEISDEEKNEPDTVLPPQTPDGDGTEGDGTGGDDTGGENGDNDAPGTDDTTGDDTTGDDTTDDDAPDTDTDDTTDEDTPDTDAPDGTTGEDTPNTDTADTTDEDTPDTDAVDTTDTDASDISDTSHASDTSDSSDTSVTDLL